MVLVSGLKNEKQNVFFYLERVTIMKNIIYCMVFIMAIGIVNAASIGISITNDSTMQPEYLAGAPGVRVGNWNSWAGGNTTFPDDIIDDSGAVTGMAATITDAGRFNDYFDGVNDQALFGDAADVFAGSGGSPRTVTCTNVPYAVYDVYCYMKDDSNGTDTNRAGSYTIGDTTYYIQGLLEGDGDPADDGTGYILSDDTTYGTGADIAEGNYCVFRSVTGESFDLIVASEYGSDGRPRNKFAGFQIVEQQVIPVVPLDRATAVSIDQDLQWSVIDPNVTHLDLYFGPEDDPNLTTPTYKRLSMEPVSTTTWEPGTMDYSKMYYWHIDLYEPNELGSDYIKVASATWSFETETPAPIIQTYSNVITALDLLPASLSAVVTDADTNLSSAAFAVTSAPEGSVYTLTQDVTDPYAPTAELATDSAGTYEVTLTVTDTEANTDEMTAQVDVYETACEAAQVDPDWAGFNAMDFDEDCDVDMEDFVSFALQWLDDRNLKAQVTY